ncbi:hypothetical protein [Erythrobacter sp. HKB08]|uniref:hypothetical protein n=1 Tax=Erythrobacter sp. HKB08 TaxID=2502843 RepID=UPI0010093664|nr:hypothetical protein [Erythrobacter sp. HKB08]
MGLIRKISGGRIGIVLGAAFLLLASPVFAPQLLAFPHKTETAIGTIWSETELPQPLVVQITERTEQRLATSSLAEPEEQRPIFITDGGWRWIWLSQTSKGAFALTRPFTRAVVVNRVDPATGLVTNGQAIGGERELSAVLAHEFTHGMIRRRFGIIASQRFPHWKVEGYCDHVAGESSLSAEEVERLESEGTDHPAIPYYRGRLRVAEILAENGNSVEKLFTQEH